MPNINTINLLPKSEFEKSFWGKALKWALSAGRYIIILTETVVIAAFMSRFWLDQTFSDLSEANMTKQLILNATANTEKHFRDIQKRLNLTGQVLAQAAPIGETLDAFVGQRPEGVKLISITVASNHEVNVKATAENEDQLGGLIQALLTSQDKSGKKMWKNVSLGNVESKTGGDLDFLLSLKF